MSIVTQLKNWKTGPLPDGDLELAALRLFSIAHPMADFALGEFSALRNQYRAEVVKLTLLPWTLANAADLLAEQSIRLAFGDHVKNVSDGLKAEVHSYAQSYIEDLWPVIGRPGMPTIAISERLVS